MSRLWSCIMLVGFCLGCAAIGPIEPKPKHEAKYERVPYEVLAAIDRGYLAAQKRAWVEDDPDVAKLREMKGKRVKSVGLLRTSTDKKTVGVWLYPDDGDDGMLVIARSFLSKEKASAFRARFPEEKAVTMYMTIRHEFGEVATDPFEVDAVQAAEGEFLDFR